jgi:hypothetical protein
MSTPGVIIDGCLVHSGSVPSKDTVQDWLTGSAESNGCGGDAGQNKDSGNCCG